MLVAWSETLSAAEVPKSPERLREAATHIIIGTVTKIDIRSQYSRVEEGSFDYVIACSIAVDSLVKGDGIRRGDELIAHCFRPKSRLGLLQQISLQGHRPVPALGLDVRAYLVAREGKYHVIHPNGFAPAGSTQLIPADEVLRLGRWAPIFTFLLPFEAWLLIAFVAAAAGIFLKLRPNSRFRNALTSALSVAAALAIAGVIAGVIGYLTTVDI